MGSISFLWWMYGNPVLLSSVSYMGQKLSSFNVPCVHRVPRGFQDNMVLKQIEVYTCTLLWLTVKLRSF